MQRKTSWIHLCTIHKLNLDRVIFIDDDNYLTDNKNFLSGHEATGSLFSGNAIDLKKWINIYEKLNVENNIPIFQEDIRGNIEV